MNNEKWNDVIKDIVANADSKSSQKNLSSRIVDEYKKLKEDFNKNKTSILFHNISKRFALDGFRYSLTLLFVSVKLGLFSYLNPNPLSDVSWFIVFLPAYFLELGFGIFLVLMIIGAVIGIVIGLLVASIKFVIERRTFSKKIADKPPMEKMNW